jgi:hypothetical protein
MITDENKDTYKNDPRYDKNFINLKTKRKYSFFTAVHLYEDQFQYTLIEIGLDTKTLIARFNEFQKLGIFGDWSQFIGTEKEFYSEYELCSTHFGYDEN